MRLLRLLNAGSSLIGSHKDAIRYRMGDPRAMPKFETAKNPFRAKTETRTMPEQPVAAAAPNISPAPISTPIPASGSDVQPGSSALTRWARGILGGWWARTRKDEPRAVPQFAKPAVQGELSLDSVKVVRNDLSDADWEIVPAKAQPVATEAVAVAIEPGGDPGFRLWRGPRRSQAPTVEVDQT